MFLHNYLYEIINLQDIMVVKKVQILNYKSIKDVSILFSSYGKGTNRSNSAFFVGLNESGKTAILEALALINEGFDGLDYDELCFKNALDEDEYLELFIDYEVTNMSFYQKKILSNCDIPQNLVNKISIINLRKNIYKNSEECDQHIKVKIAPLDCFEYYMENNSIKLIKSAKSIKTKITKANAHNYLANGEKLLTKEKLEFIIAAGLKSTFEFNYPKIEVWKPKEEFLINKIINLSTFKDDTSQSIPLRNIFKVSGFETDEQIKKVIERALVKQEKCDELKEKLSSNITKHINKIWKEHKIKIVVSINSSNCQVFVEDKDKRHNYYRMEQRSDGFKQFVSLMLSLSVLNTTHNLSNKIILIDEPEVHLHPSGIRYMRDELIKIGKKNHVFISTHSHYMIDTSCAERHLIVKKEKGETIVNQIGENTSIEDDAVLLSAFGLNMVKELLPRNVLIVEGGGDKEIISHILKLYGVSNFSIKSSGGASKISSIASLLINENVPCSILLDDDKEGKDAKRNVMRKFKEYYNETNLFTLKDLVNDLPSNSTIEDLLPNTFLTEFLSNQIGQIKIEVDKPCIFQLKNTFPELKKNKEKLESIKIKLSKAFIKKYKTKASIKKVSSSIETFVSVINRMWINNAH